MTYILAYFQWDWQRVSVANREHLPSMGIDEDFLLLFPNHSQNYFRDLGTDYGGAFPWGQGSKLHKVGNNASQGFWAEICWEHFSGRSYGHPWKVKRNQVTKLLWDLHKFVPEPNSSCSQNSLPRFNFMQSKFKRGSLVRPYNHWNLLA